MLENLHLENVIYHIINTIIFFVIVRFLVYKPMRKFMSARSERIAASLAQAKQAREEAEALHAQAGTIIAEAEEKARTLSLEITGAANESARAMTESAKSESRALLEKARTDMQEAHDGMIAGLQGEVIDLAAAMARQILNNAGGESP